MTRRALLLMWSVGVSGCAAAAEDKLAERRPEVTQIASDLDVVRKHRILFSHHSVGRDLLAGLDRVSSKAGAPIRPVPLEQAAASSAPAFVSISGGQNQQPQTKFDFFTETLRKTEYKPELAFLKLCYVDFNPSTDVDALFAAYQKTIDTLRRERPETQFAHITTPLYERPMQLKDRLYRFIGKEVWEDSANVKRFQFNQRLMKTYAQDPIFDLAKVESTRPDGSRSDFSQSGGVYYSLASQYTDDGGHLNGLGQDVAAVEWVRFMASALKRAAGHN